MKLAAVSENPNANDFGLRRRFFALPGERFKAGHVLFVAVYHPYTIHTDVKWRSRVPKTNAIPTRIPDSEKITINLGFVDLGQIELLVREGFYSNRSDFIRTAIRNQIERHADSVRQIVVRKSVDLGLRHITRDELVEVQAAGEMLDIRVLGLVVIAQDVTPDLARDTISALSVLGTLHAPQAVEAALANRLT